jgi:ABC-type transport system substrate-binding protein
MKIGVKMNIQMVDWAVQQKKMDDKDFDAFTGGWAMPWDPDPYQVWHSSQADVPKGSNRVGFRNKEADKIIEEARVTFEPQKRHELFHRFHAIIHEEQPYSFFYAPKSVGAWRDYVKRVVFRKIKPHSDSRPWWVDVHPGDQASLRKR